MKNNKNIDYGEAIGSALGEGAGDSAGERFVFLYEGLPAREIPTMRELKDVGLTAEEAEKLYWTFRLVKRASNMQEGRWTDEI